MYACMDKDDVWLQSSLPIRYAGIGIQRASQLASSAFLASAVDSLDLVNELLPSYQ
jgi:hypothetical protein